ncbi:MAG: SpoIIE family protein phosphatase [Deferribacteres bacterium]|nr:SpoIIE family protein phosphatase [candidate division KSB1 bacterium]MCB9503902.1 SpoIIE family protein phosphatase [Deferribacteres bacterium]
MKKNNFFDRHPQFYRFLLGLAAVVVLWIWIVAFYNAGRRATDENIFLDIPSPLYIKSTIPSTLIAADVQKPTAKSSIPKSIETGDILISVNGTMVRSKKEVYSLLNELPDAAYLDLLVLNPKQNRNFNFSVKRSDFSLRDLRDLGPAVYVIQVFPGGASDRAGMKAGDLIVSINGQDFKDMFEADAIMSRGRSGTTVQYVILRDNEWHTLQVTLAEFDINVSFILFSICGILVLGTGLFIGMRKPRLIAARFVGLGLFLIGSYFAIMGALVFRMQNPFHIFILFMTASLSLSCFVHGRIYFPIFDSGLYKRLIFVKISYGLSFALAMSFFIFGLKVSTWIAILQGLLALYLFFYDTKVYSEEYKRLVKPMKYLNFSGGLLSALIAVLVYYYGNNNMAGYTGIPILFLPFSYFYVIGRYRLLELDLRMRKNIQYVIVTIVWSVFLILCFIYIMILIPKLSENMPAIHFSGTLFEISRGPFDTEATQATQSVFIMLAAVFVAYVGLRLSRFGQGIIDTKFYRNKYDYQVTTRMLTRVLTKQLSLISLATGIVKMLTEQMQLKRTGVILLRNEADGCCQEHIGFKQSAWLNFYVDSLPGLAEILRNPQNDMRFGIQSFPQQLKDACAELGVMHVLKISSQGQLLGAVLIGEKRSETPFHNDDLDFLSYVAQQAAVAIENAFLHETITEQERLKHELEIARRIQLSSLPTKAPALPGLDIAGTSVPALEVGGDYFDYLNNKENNVTVIVGDVSGKGTSAALYMSRMQGIMRSLITFNLQPRELLIHANKLLQQNLDKQFFMTILGGNFNATSKKLVLARAGHLPLYYFNNAKAKVELITPSGIGLGLNSNSIFENHLEEHVINYSAGDVFLFVTDGITEAIDNNNEEFGEKGLINFLQQHCGKSAGDLCHLLMSTLAEYESRDDQTIVVVKAG